MTTYTKEAEAAIAEAATTAGLVPHADVCRAEETKWGGCQEQLWHRHYMTPDAKVAVQFRADGTVDEVLGKEVDVHIETMSEQSIWMVLGRLSMDFESKQAKKPDGIELRATEYWGDDSAT